MVLADLTAPVSEDDTADSGLTGLTESEDVSVEQRPGAVPPGGMPGQG